MMNTKTLHPSSTLKGSVLEAPLVSKEQVTALEDANAQLARIRVDREERAKRLGIPSKL